jgi:hypothetical protein
MIKTKTTEANSLSWIIDELVSQNKKEMIDFSVPVQRGYVWDNKRNSLLMHSILLGIPISEFYFNKVGDTYEGLEGKQRNKAICDFVDGIYKLHANTPSVELDDGTEFPIARYSFSKLPKELQNRILRYPLRIYWFNDVSIDDKVLIFTRINSGRPVTAADISRIKVMSRKTFLSFTEHSAISIAVREKSKMKCFDEDIVQDIWILSNVDNPNLLNRYRSPILEKSEVTVEQRDEINQALDYMFSFYQKIEDNKKLFSKVRAKTHITSLGYMGVFAVRNGISEEEFMEKARKFFDTDGTKVTISDAYNVASLSGSAKTEQVKIRMNELEAVLKS